MRGLLGSRRVPSRRQLTVRYEDTRKPTEEGTRGQLTYGRYGTRGRTVRMGGVECLGGLWPYIYWGSFVVLRRIFAMKRSDAAARTRTQARTKKDGDRAGRDAQSPTQNDRIDRRTLASKQLCKVSDGSSNCNQLYIRNDTKHCPRSP
eukprot:4843475-Prymnesium_polylepis.1